MKYIALASAPQTRKTHEISHTDRDGKPVYFHELTGWKQLGPAENYEDARKRYGGRPVLTLQNVPH